MVIAILQIADDHPFIIFSPARNLIEAASNGAIAAIKVVASVAANLIAILGLIAFLNALLSYVGARVGLPSLSFQVYLMSLIVVVLRCVYLSY